MSFLSKFTKIMKIIADIVIAGREMGLWSKKPTIQAAFASPVQFDFSWGKALWKGIRLQLIVTALIAISTFFGAFDEVVEWTKYGTPEIIATFAVGAVEVVRNVLKQWLEAYKQIAKG